MTKGPRDKQMTVEEVVAELRDGMTIGIGGWGPRRKPMALVRAILRSDLKDLTIVSWGGADVGLLARAGKIRKLVYAFVSLDTIPLEPNFQKARQDGTIPEVVELDEGMFNTGLQAAAQLRLDRAHARAGRGQDARAVEAAEARGGDVMSRRSRRAAAASGLCVRWRPRR